MVSKSRSSVAVADETEDTGADRWEKIHGQKDETDLRIDPQAVYGEGPTEAQREDAIARKKAQNARAAELLAEHVADPHNEAGMPVVVQPVWTLDAMRKREPIEGDVYQDGKFMIAFHPEKLSTPYVTIRLARYEQYKSGTLEWLDVTVGYSEIIKEGLHAWPLRETIEDKDGKDLYDDVEKDGQIIRTVRSVPLPITLDNINRLDYEMKVEIINCMQRTMRGEVSGQD